jgi:GNAT superfamily N-acetyltransferase
MTVGRPDPSGSAARAGRPESPIGEDAAWLASVVVVSDTKDRRIRIASPDEFDRLREIELEADRMFEEVGIGPFSNADDDDHLDAAAVVFATGTPAVGFACVEIVDGLAHLWQLSVHPRSGHQGRGRALVEAVCDWARSHGYPAVTLTTFTDVPWNGPFYARLGFHPIVELSPGLKAIRDHERAIGDDEFGARTVMRKDL